MFYKITLVNYCISNLSIICVLHVLNSILRELINGKNYSDYKEEYIPDSADSNKKERKL